MEWSEELNKKMSGVISETTVYEDEVMRVIKKTGIISPRYKLLFQSYWRYPTQNRVWDRISSQLWLNKQKIIAYDRKT